MFTSPHGVTPCGSLLLISVAVVTSNRLSTKRFHDNIRHKQFLLLFQSVFTILYETRDIRKLHYTDAELLYVTAGGTYAYHKILKGREKQAN